VLNLDGLTLQGADDAMLVLVEFSDFECPYCRRHSTGVFKELIREFVESGQMMYGFAHNPLTDIHPLARSLSAAAICADRQGLFWPMHDALYDQEIGAEADIALAGC
jgi:protein-disulfide isomerase